MTQVDALKKRAAARINKEAANLIGLSHKIFETPELNYEEFESSALLVGALRDGGMKVEYPAHGLETAFRATAGSQGPHILICAEYDALPDIGHACGHNIIGTSAVGAGLALSELAEELGIRVTVLGTPAEEGGGGKVVLLDNGAFEGVDAAMMVHPAPLDVVDMPSLAVAVVQITYHGKESHASAFPELGRNALDAMNIAYTAIAALRQHIRSTERIHGIITHGGDAPNIVPKMTKARYYVRALNLGELSELKERVMRCFEAGAVATGCELEPAWEARDYAEVVTNPVMAEVYERNVAALGRNPVPRALLERYPGSTDMGNVSLALPSIHPMMGIDSLPAVNHQAEFAQHTITDAGDKAITDAATAMAWTTIDLATSQDLLGKAKEAFEAGPPEPAFKL